MDRRTFVLGTAAAALHAVRLSAWQGAAIELGSIDGSVSGNNFTPAQFLDYLSSIKLTWAMLSLAPAVLGDETALREIRSHADRLGIKLLLALHVFAAGFLATRPGNPRRARIMAGAGLSGLIVILIADYLKTIY